MSFLVVIILISLKFIDQLDNVMINTMKIFKYSNLLTFLVINVSILYQR